ATGSWPITATLGSMSDKSRNGLGLKAPNGDDNAADPQYRFLAARPHSRWALRRQANDDQRHRAEFWDLEAALDEGRQPSQSKRLSRNSARPQRRHPADARTARHHDRTSGARDREDAGVYCVP